MEIEVRQRARHQEVLRAELKHAAAERKGNVAAYDTPEMKEFLLKNPDAKIAIDQIVFAKSWFATYKTVPVRKALEDEVQAMLSGKKSPKEALVAAQKSADEILKPYIDQTSMKLPKSGS